MIERWAFPIILFASILAIWFYLRRPAEGAPAPAESNVPPTPAALSPMYAPPARLESPAAIGLRPFPNTLRYPGDLTIDQVMGIEPPAPFDPRAHTCGCEG